MATPASTLAALLAFVRIVSAGSFAAAARQLGVTTSALSKTITRLERDHGVRLLHRTTHSISLTPEGERLLGPARQLLRQADDVAQLLDHSRDGGATGCVRISAPGPLIRSCLIPLLPAFQRDRPGIGLELKLDDATLDLAAAGIDIALRFGPSPGQPGLKSRRILRFPWLICASPSIVPDPARIVSPAHLDALPQIAFRHVSDGQIMPWRLRDPDSGREVRHAPKQHVIVEDLTAIAEMVAAGMGVAWLPDWCLTGPARPPATVELLPAWRGRPTDLHAVRLDSAIVPERIQIVLRELIGALATPS